MPLVSCPIGAKFTQISNSQPLTGAVFGACRVEHIRKPKGEEIFQIDQIRAEERCLKIYSWHDGDYGGLVDDGTASQWKV